LLTKRVFARAKNNDFYDVTPIWDKAVSGDPNSMPVDILRNKCILIFRIVLFSSSADLAKWQPHLLTSQNRFYVRFLAKMGKWRNHSVTGAHFFLLSISTECADTPAFFALGKSIMLERPWVLSTLQKWP